MNTKFRKTLGQILAAVGITLLMGGFASFFSNKVELRFLGNSIVTENSRIIWIFINTIITLIGILLLYSSKKNSKKSN